METNKQIPVIEPIYAVLSAIVATFTVPPTTEKFVAKDKFKVDTSEKAKVKILSLNDNFKEWFLDKVENPLIGSTVNGRKLKILCVGGPILAQLGGKELAKTTLTELYAAMAAQPNGESGDLLNNGWANSFFIEDINGRLRCVSVFGDDGGWHVDADPVGDPSVWYIDDLIFSRKSSGVQVHVS